MNSRCEGLRLKSLICPQVDSSKTRESRRDEVAGSTSHRITWNVMITVVNVKTCVERYWVLFISLHPPNIPEMCALIILIIFKKKKKKQVPRGRGNSPKSWNTGKGSDDN